MTLPRKPRRGGFHRPVKLGLFIRDYLLQVPEAGTHEIYRAYKEEVQATAYPPIKTSTRTVRTKIVGGKTKKERLPRYTQRRDKRRTISYEGFRKYIYILKRLGLIEETGGTNPALGSYPEAGGILAPVKLLRIVDASQEEAWNDPWEALYPGKRGR